MTLEIEMKLSASPDAVRQVTTLNELAQLANGPVLHQRLISVYYDTPVGTLRSRGVALRMRRQQGKWVQTLKYRGECRDGIAYREEWDTPSDGYHLDFSSLKDDALRDYLLSGPVYRHLKPRFVTDFERTTWPLRTAGGAEIELAVDLGEVRTGLSKAPLSEIELELKSGPPDELQVLSSILQSRLPLIPEAMSKAERGYVLLEREEDPSS